MTIDYRLYRCDLADRGISTRTRDHYALLVDILSHYFWYLRSTPEETLRPAHQPSLARLKLMHVGAKYGRRLTQILFAGIALPL